MGSRYDIVAGIDNHGYEALMIGAVGWVAGLVVAFPSETSAICELIRQERHAEALAIYRWFRPFHDLDLDVSTSVVQQIKLAEVHAFGSNERVRGPRLPLSSEHRARVETIIKAGIATRPDLPAF